jgi:hypothetical protein
VDEKQTVGGRDVAVEPTRMYSKRVSVRPDSCLMSVFDPSNASLGLSLINGRHRGGAQTAYSLLPLWVDIRQKGRINRLNLAEMRTHVKSAAAFPFR